MAEATKEHLMRRYGARWADVARVIATDPELAAPITSDLPDVWGEVVFAARDEHAQTVEDILRRRLGVFRNSLDQGLEAAPRVAQMLASQTGASGRRQAEWTLGYERAVQSTRDWKRRL